MKRNAIAVATLLVVVPALSMGAGGLDFEGGLKEVVASLSAPSFQATVNLTVPAGFRAAKATMNVTGMASEGNASAYSEDAELTLDGTTIWAFQQTGFGQLGRQDRFSNDEKETQLQFGNGGGISKTAIRLPKGAVVQSAQMELKALPDVEWQELVNISGAGWHEYLGGSVSSAGDVNNDSYDDIIVGGRIGKSYLFFGGANMDGNADVVFNTPQDANWQVTVSGAGDVNGDGYDDVIVGTSTNDSGGTDAGRAYVYFGGQNMDNTADVIVTGANAGDKLGYSVSGAGDVNGDGYDDVIVGAPYNATGGTEAGQANIYFGGQNMDNSPDVILTGTAYRNFMGLCVSGAGDVNGDGYDDVIVNGWTVYKHASTIYYGGANMDNISDVNLTSPYPVSDAGDVNNDGFDDVIVGDLKYYGGTGYVYLYFGGPNMDGDEDINFTSLANGKSRDPEWYLSSAGDFNNDEYDDIIIGDIHYIGADQIGKGIIYLGGKAMDTMADVTFTHVTPAGDFDDFGGSVSGAGDLNNDGHDEVVVGASWNDTGDDSDAGNAYVFGFQRDGILDPGASIGSKSIWNRTDYFNGTASLGGFDGEINAFLSSAPTTGTDSYGNAYVDVPVNVNASSYGTLVLSKLNITYSSSATTPDFSSALNNYLVFHQNEMDVGGNINVPVGIRAQSAGRIKLSGLELVADRPPSQVDEIGTAELDEDGWNTTLIDLYPYFQDDIDPDSKLDFNVVSTTNSTFVTVGIRNKRYLSADAFTGDANDNWTGTVEAVVACSDHWGQKIESNQFTIIVKNVNDLPVITSTPVTAAEPGVSYYYNITAVDGDKDILRYTLATAPENMTIDPDKGTIQWLPGARGAQQVRVVVDDGNSTAEQGFGIVVANRPPRITSSPPLNASVGIPYIYNVTAEDPNSDALNFSLSGPPDGMQIDSATGTITWTPTAAGNFDISVKVGDGKERTFQNFSIIVVQGNRAPEFKSIPVTMATVDTLYTYTALAKDPDSDILTYSIVSGPEGMTIDGAKGRLAWTPSTAGNFTVVLKGSDGKGAEARQEFVINVLPAMKPQIILLQPPLDRNLTGMITFSGTVTKGTREVIQVQMRVDEGEWNDAIGRYIWTCTFNSKSLKNGQHDFEFRAYDGKEYSDVLRVEYKVDHPVPKASSSVLAEASMAGAIIASVTVLGLAYTAYSETGKFKMALFFLPLYTRLQKAVLLDNETRGMIRGCIYTDPGIHYSEILRNLNLSNGAAAYHLMTLEREGLIKSRSEGRWRRFYPATTRLVDLPPKLDKVQRIIVETVRENEGLVEREVARMLNLPSSTVNRQITRLAEQGVLRLEKDGMTIRCYIAEEPAPEGPGPGS